MNIKWTTLCIIIFNIGLSGCSSLLYHPTQVLHYEPKQLNLKPEDIFIQVDPSITLHGWYFKSETKPKGVIVFFHGNAQNLTSHYVNLSWIVKEGFDYFIWDYRSYGQSTGEPSPKNTVEDGVRVIQHLYSKNPKLPLFVLGQSLGGAVAMRSVVELGGQIPIRAVIADSTFQSYQSVGRSVLSKHWLTWLFQPLVYLVLSDKYAPEGKVSQISPIPLLVIHGKKDPVIDYKFGLELFEDAAEPKQFLSVEEGTHISGFWASNRDEVRKEFLEFLNTKLP